MIDLRSDTVTRPSPAMYQAMATAEVGDDVFGDDPTVRELEETTADMLGFEAGLYVTSGTQSNFTAVLTHCGRGEEYIIGEAYHVYRAEAVGTAALGGIIPQTVPVLEDGSVDLDLVEARIKPEDLHFPRTRPDLSREHPQRQGAGAGVHGTGGGTGAPARTGNPP